MPVMFNTDTSNLIDRGSERLLNQLSELDLNEIGISDYNQRYLNQYIKNYPFYIDLYKQLLTTAIEELSMPVQQSVFLDYGGGCGFLSLLAKSIGFGKVIYSDIYDVSLNDAKLISEKTTIRIDHFILGDVDEVVDEMIHKQLNPDLICSFDVLEHIYSPKEWFTSISRLKKSFSIVFITSANPYNPIIRNRLKKLQRQAEYEGTTAYWGMKKRDSKIPYLLARKEIIKEMLPNADDKTLNSCAKQTRGLHQKDIAKVIDEYKKTGRINYAIKHPTNTCDPFTGNWTENLIDIKSLRSMLILLGFKTEVISGFYSYSNNKTLNFAKTILNHLIRGQRNWGLYLSSTYILKAKR